MEGMRFFRKLFSFPVVGRGGKKDVKVSAPSFIATFCLAPHQQAGLEYNARALIHSPGGGVAGWRRPPHTAPPSL